MSAEIKLASKFKLPNYDGFYIVDLSRVTAHALVQNVARVLLIYVSLVSFMLNFLKKCETISTLYVLNFLAEM